VPDMNSFASFLDLEPLVVAMKAWGCLDMCAMNACCGGMVRNHFDYS
jgi:hypothetical protein